MLNAICNIDYLFITFVILLIREGTRPGYYSKAVAGLVAMALLMVEMPWDCFILISKFWRTGKFREPTSTLTGSPVLKYLL